MKGYSVICMLLLTPLLIQAQKNIGTHLVSHEKRANTLFQSFSYEEALLAYKAALFQHPDNDSLKLMVAETYRLLNEPKNAVKYYEMVINNDKIIIPIHKYYYAQTLNALGNYDEALVWYKKYDRDVTDSKARRNIQGLENITDLLQDSLEYHIKNISAVNSKRSDFSATFYKDGIVFVSDRAHNQAIRPVYNWTKSNFLNLYYTKQNKDGSYLKPILFKDFNTKLHEGPTVFYDNENKVILTRNITKRGMDKEETIKIGLFTAKLKDNDSWSNVEELPFNSDKYSVGHPAITKDGKTIFFVSDMPGGVGGTDIYKSEWNEGSWSQPVNLGDIINTEGDEQFVFYHEDGVLYFSSNGHGTLGGLDIYKANLGKNPTVTNLGSQINSIADDFGLILSRDGQSGYFSSNRRNGIGGDDLYYFTVRSFGLDLLVQDQETGEAQLLKVTDEISTSNVPAETKIVVENTELQLQYDQSPLNGAGKMLSVSISNNEVFNATIQPEDTEKEVEIRTMHHPNYSEGLEVGTIGYEFDKSGITDEALRLLDKTAILMANHPELRIILNGHTDSRGSKTYNYGLAQRRADAAKKYLLSKGIGKDRIVTKSYGEIMLLNECKDNVECSESKHQENRRTEMRFK